MPSSVTSGTGEFAFFQWKRVRSSRLAIVFRRFEILITSSSYWSVIFLCLTSPFRSRSIYSSTRRATACLFHLHERIPVGQFNRTSRGSGPDRVSPSTKSFTRPEEAHGGRAPTGRPSSSFRTRPFSRRNARRAPLRSFTQYNIG
jgi:hypothetical protein